MLQLQITVTVEDGTGLVHTAYAFGEDDYNTCRKYGVDFAEPVDEKGCFTTTPWEGRFVMEEVLMLRYSSISLQRIRCLQSKRWFTIIHIAGDAIHH